MPSFVPRSLEPYHKRDLFEKRVRQLRGVVKAGASGSRVSNAAGKVRLAALMVIKAKRALVRGHDREQQLYNLQQEEERWVALTAEEIIAQFASADHGGGCNVAKGRQEDKRTRFLRQLRQQFQRIRFRPLEAVVIRMSDSAPLPPSVQARFDNGLPFRLYPIEGGAHLVKWPHTGELLLPEGHWLEPGGWDHEHCSACDRHIRPGRTFWQTAAGTCYWLCPYCYRRLRQLQ